MFALCKRLRMRINGIDLLHRNSRKSQKHMLYSHALLTHNIKLIFCQKIINIRHNPLCGILDRKHRIIGLSKSNLLHRRPKGSDMVAVDLIRKICPHGCIAVCTLHALKNYIDILKRKFIHHFIVFLHINAILGQKLVLTLAADRHDLLKQFLGTKAVKASMCLILQDIKLILLSLGIQNLFSCMYLVFCNILTDFHSFLKQP